MRQVVLDTETTGLEPQLGHRIIEIGAVEVVERKHTGRYFHQYLQPDREIDSGAMAVHGITNEFLIGKPRFADVVAEFLAFIEGAEVIIHNAPFDVGFIDHELVRLAPQTPKFATRCSVVDSLLLARQMHPGQKNSLDALCKRYDVNNAHRQWHGALLDAQILADVHLAMTGGQVALALGGSSVVGGLPQGQTIRRLSAERVPLNVIRATEAEMAAHDGRLKAIDKASEGKTVWRTLQ